MWRLNFMVSHYRTVASVKSKGSQAASSGEIFASPCPPHDLWRVYGGCRTHWRHSPNRRRCQRKRHSDRGSFIHYCCAGEERSALVRTIRRSALVSIIRCSATHNRCQREGRDTLEFV